MTPGNADLLIGLKPREGQGLLRVDSRAEFSRRRCRRREGADLYLVDGLG
jgi:hypothetical protein